MNEGMIYLIESIVSNSILSGRVRQIIPITIVNSNVQIYVPNIIYYGHVNSSASYDVSLLGKKVNINQIKSNPLLFDYLYSPYQFSFDGYQIMIDRGIAYKMYDGDFNADFSNDFFNKIV